MLKMDWLWDEGEYPQKKADKVSDVPVIPTAEPSGVVKSQPDPFRQQAGTGYTDTSFGLDTLKKPLFAPDTADMTQTFTNNFAGLKPRPDAWQAFTRSQAVKPATPQAGGFPYKEMGQVLKADEKTAADWYLKAAEAGNPDGVCNVAGIMMYSKIVETDYKQAHELLEACLKVQPTNDCCLDRMAELYGGGYGVPTDYKKAHELREKSAASGSAYAMYNLGRDFDYGIGAEKDAKAAMGWYLKAAAKGHAKALYRLYEVYEYGKLGQPIDKVKAAEWKARAEKAMKEQGVSRNEWVDAFRLKMEAVQ